jgi:hypothetical protein
MLYVNFVFIIASILVSLRLLFFPGIVFFIIRWWNPATFEAMHPEGSLQRATWPYVEDKSYLWTWLFLVPLVAYSLWQILYFLIVNVLRRQRLLRDPEVMTSYRFYFFFQFNMYFLLGVKTSLFFLIVDFNRSQGTLEKG